MKNLIYILFFLSFTVNGQILALVHQQNNGEIVAPKPSLEISPVINNFLVKNNESSKIYFDSSEPITATTYTGFIVSGKSINEIHINSGQNTGHYFTVSVPFTFWDNNTIRYEGGSNIQDADSNGVYDFTLTYILNNITEPDASTNRYVNASASGGGNGLSDGTAWTLAEGISNSAAGQTIWIKAGAYSGGHELNNSGSVSSPIKFKGYTTDIGDLDNDYIVDDFTYTNSTNAESQIDNTKYPVLTGNGTYGVYGFYLNNEDYVIFKNIQIKKFYYNFWAIGAYESIVLENMTTALAFSTTTNIGGGLGIYSGTTTTGYRFRINKCLSFDNGGVNLRLYGNYNAITNSETYSGIDSEQSSDYYISLYQSQECIVYNNTAERIGDIEHGGHGIGSKNHNGNYVYQEHNLFSHNITTNISEAFYLAHSTDGCVMKYNEVYSDPTMEDIVVAFVIRDGGKNNIIENNYGESILRSHSFLG